MDLWDTVCLRTPGIIACTGAGGKTSLILSLSAGAKFRKIPLVITTTTKMYYDQIIKFQQVASSTYEEGSLAVKELLAKEHTVVWFREIKSDKIIGIPPEWIDRFSKENPNYFILVEADGAAQTMIKAPAAHEPVVPNLTSVTIGVLSLDAIGKPLSAVTAHRLPLVLKLLGKQQGDIVEWLDLIKLATHKFGIFQYSKGQKILLLSGANSAVSSSVFMKEYFQKVDHQISRCILASGYGFQMQPIGVYNL
ncbi:selenium cofactor biosynthesis protein YqeC [Dendrosporobacter sp. 1207_IL3150]|uniref:selenium cofactor biosynthesis protein YqeC n=1 Tax=Dendrosporobacter sp. 1207_IL3150 TaxID=3084054 RepID=UPI002FDB7A82